MQVGFGNLGGILASFVYLSKDGPRFIQGHCILIGMLIMSTSLLTIMTIYLRRENAWRDATYKDPEEYTIEEKIAERERGDSASFFRYTV